MYVNSCILDNNIVVVTHVLFVKIQKYSSTRVPSGKGVLCTEYSCTGYIHKYLFINKYCFLYVSNISKCN